MGQQWRGKLGCSHRMEMEVQERRKPLRGQEHGGWLDQQSIKNFEKFESDQTGLPLWTHLPKVMLKSQPSDGKDR